MDRAADAGRRLAAPGGCKAPVRSDLVQPGAQGGAFLNEPADARPRRRRTTRASGNSAPAVPVNAVPADQLSAPAHLPFCRTRRFHLVHTPPSFRAPRCMHYRLPGRSARKIVPQQLEPTLEG